jgi:pimeloyl-ACP methyl ester carboxylesterase
MHIRVDDVRLFFDVEGAKLRPDGPVMREVPTLLLLHGGPGFDHSGFKPGFSEAAEYAQVVYLDLRGNGRSDEGPSDKWSLAQWALDVRQFCEALGIKAPVVLAHSLGGIVAMVYATTYPDHLSKLILSSTSTQPVGERSFGIFERLGGPPARAAAMAFRHQPDHASWREYEELCIPLHTGEAAPAGYGDLPSVLNMLSDDVELFIFGSLKVPWAGHWRGRKGAEEFLMAMGNAAEVNDTPDILIGAGDSVIAIHRPTLRVRATRRVADFNVVHVWTFCDGLIVRMREYADTAAWEAAFDKPLV